MAIPTYKSALNWITFHCSLESRDFSNVNEKYRVTCSHISSHNSTRTSHHKRISPKATDRSLSHGFNLRVFTLFSRTFSKRNIWSHMIR